MLAVFGTAAFVGFVHCFVFVKERAVSQVVIRCYRPCDIRARSYDTACGVYSSCGLTQRERSGLRVLCTVAVCYLLYLLALVRSRLL